MGFPGGSAGKNLLVGQKTQETPRAQSSGREDPLEEGIATHSRIQALKSPTDRGAWQATVHRVTQSQTQQKRWSMHVQHGQLARKGFSKETTD